MTLVTEAALQEREPCDISELTFGIRCGGSGAISAITSNASVGQAIDMFIDHGARGVFSETVEIVGAESTLAKRAATPEVADKIYAAAQKMTDKVAAYGVDIIGAEPGIGNIKQGLSTIEEKSLGAIVKSGTRPLMDVLEYATKPTKGPGMYFMDGSAISSILYVGMSCAGAQVMLHTYGGGIDARMRSITTMPGGLKTLPVIKVMGSAVDDVAKPYFDICTDTIIRGEKSIMDMGQAIFDKAIAVASGEKPFTERECTYNEMLQFYIDGLRM